MIFIGQHDRTRETFLKIQAFPVDLLTGRTNCPFQWGQFPALLYGVENSLSTGVFRFFIVSSC